MLKFLSWFFGLFSPYANSFERKVDKFFCNVKSTDSIGNVKSNLLKLMQENLIVVNVWLEKKFKGYKSLKKSSRRKMYDNVQKIVDRFHAESKRNSLSDGQIGNLLKSQGLLFPHGDEGKIRYLVQIMSFLRPGKYYHYVKTASFGKLLRDIEKEKLEGDCNQIVTFYVYLFSLKFPLDALQIKLLPEHVCLHFRGIDIEATNGTFQKYANDKQILPVTEIISTNLLDLNDFREDVQDISSRDIVKSSQLAYAISSLKSLVSKNLDIAYHNLAIQTLEVKDFDSALFYADKAQDKNLLQAVYDSAAVYYMERNNFSRAFYYASRSGDKKLLKSIGHNEGIYYYRKENFGRALQIFSNLGDEEMKRACYQKQYNQLLKKVADVKTLEQVKNKKSVYQEMLSLAQKIGDNSLEENIRNTLRKVGY